MENYENAMIHFKESVDVIERFMYPDKQGYEAYPLGGTDANHAITLFDIMACMNRLGKTDGIDESFEKAKCIYLDAFDHIVFRDYNKTTTHKLEYFKKEYNEKKLYEYKPLDLSDIEKRIAEKNVK